MILLSAQALTAILILSLHISHPVLATDTALTLLEALILPLVQGFSPLLSLITLAKSKNCLWHVIIQSVNSH